MVVASFIVVLIDKHIHMTPQLTVKYCLYALSIKENITNELKRYNKFSTEVLGEKKEKQDVSELDIRNYAKYVLNNGTILEQREPLLNLRGKIVLKNRSLELA